MFKEDLPEFVGQCRRYGAGPETNGSHPRPKSTAPFSIEEVRNYMQASVVELRKRGLDEIATPLESLANDVDELYDDLEELERQLTALEEKMIAIARTRQSNEELLQARKEIDLQLKSYRGKMSAEQISMLEKQYLEREVLASVGLPRLSLFYLG